MLGDSNTVVNIADIIPAATPSGQVWTNILKNELHKRGLGFVSISQMGGMLTNEENFDHPDRSIFFDNPEFLASLKEYSGSYIPTVTMALGTNDILAQNDPEKSLEGLTNLISLISNNIVFDKLIIVLPSELRPEVLDHTDGTRIQLVSKEQVITSRRLRNTILEYLPQMVQGTNLVIIDPDEEGNGEEIY